MNDVEEHAQICAYEACIVGLLDMWDKLKERCQLKDADNATNIKNYRIMVDCLLSHIKANFQKVDEVVNGLPEGERELFGAAVGASRESFESRLKEHKERYFTKKETEG